MEGLMTLVGFGVVTLFVWWLHRRAAGKPFDAQMSVSWMRDQVYRSGVTREWN